MSASTAIGSPIPTAGRTPLPATARVFSASLSSLGDAAFDSSLRQKVVSAIVIGGVLLAPVVLFG